MTSTATMDSDFGGLSLIDSIADLHSQFSRFTNELRDAHCEIIRLTCEVDEWRSRARAISEIDLSSLRRDLAFYCHPDRGGDVDLMARLNVFFDSVKRRDQIDVEPASDGSDGYGEER